MGGGKCKRITKKKRGARGVAAGQLVAEKIKEDH